MINTIKAVHLSTMPDRAIFQGGIMKSFPAEADEMQWQNNLVWKYKDVYFIFFFPSFFFFTLMPIYILCSACCHHGNLKQMLLFKTMHDSKIQVFVPVPLAIFFSFSFFVNFLWAFLLHRGKKMFELGKCNVFNKF